MDHLCIFCGDELVVSVANEKRSTYCQSCGNETTSPAPARPVAPIISLNRASILKKMNDTKQQEQKKPKQLRDRTDYTKSRRAR